MQNYAVVCNVSLRRVRGSGSCGWFDALGASVLFGSLRPLITVPLSRKGSARANKWIIISALHHDPLAAMGNSPTARTCLCILFHAQFHAHFADYLVFLHNRVIVGMEDLHSTHRRPYPYGYNLMRPCRAWN